VALVRPGARWPIEIAVQAERSWSYRSTEQLSRSDLVVVGRWSFVVSR
jgi:hypothetical protein